MTQKWLAIYPEGNEAWTEQRRTGYPKLFKVKVNNSGGAINTDEMIRRLPYPEGLKTSNPTQYSSLTRALGGATQVVLVSGGMPERIISKFQ